jgi:hypothetical protein
MPARRDIVKHNDTIGFRFTPEDRRLIAELQAKLKEQRKGWAITMADVMRMGLHCLAEKEGVSV